MTTMIDSAPAFDRIISPVGCDEFFRVYWEKQFLSVRRETPDYYAYALTASEIDRYLQIQHIAPDYLRVLKGGEFCSPDQWTDVYQRIAGNSTQRVVNVRKLLELFHSGATLVINSGETAMPSLIDLCRALEYEFKHAVQANIYITPPQSQGFEPHLDTHNVFVLQIYGRKCWNLYDSPVVAPVKSTSVASYKYHEREPQQVVELEPGDLLYVPRGMVHSARSEKNTSIHVTLSPMVRQWSTLLKLLAKQADEKPDFRRLLPHGLSSSQEQVEFDAEFMRQLQGLITETDFSSLLAANFVEDQRTDNRGRFADLLRLERLTADSIVRRRHDLHYAVKRDHQWITIHFEGEEINLPLFLEAAVIQIFEEKPFTVGAIDGIPNEAGKLALVRRFVQAGFLTIVSL